MRLALTTWSFPYCSLGEAVQITKALGINALDMGIDYGAAIDRDALLSNPEKTGKDLLRYEIEMPCFYYRFGQELAERNIADARNMAANTEDFRKVVAFCHAAGIKRIFVLPGLVNPGQSLKDAQTASIAALKQLVPIAQEAGIILTMEAHVRSIVESPSATFELLNNVPDLKLALDYSHFVCMGYTQADIDPLVPYAAHMHLRQAKPGALQEKFDYGTINFATLIGTLNSAGYDDYLALEVVHQDYMNTRSDDVLTEIIQLRDLVRRYI